jgi:ATP-dependent RNA helicase DDX18/HAS1
MSEEEDKEKETVKKVKSGGGIMSTESFDSLGLSEPTRKAIQEIGFEYMTQVYCFFFSGFCQGT